MPETPPVHVSLPAADDSQLARPPAIGAQFASLGPPAAWELPAATVEEYRPRAHAYCVLIPVLNEGQRIRDQLAIMRDLPDMPDVVICDGGSTDGCTDAGAMAELGVTAVLRKTGPGKMSAQLRLLMAYALLKDYAGMVHMDGNNKDEPTCIADHIRHLRGEYDCVVSSRFRRGGQSINTPLYRVLAIRAVHAPLVSVAARRWLTDTTNSFRGYSARFIRDPRVQPFRNVFIAYNLPFYLVIRASRLGFRVTEIPVARRYPKGKVPTKIKGIWGHLDNLGELFETLMGRYNPRTSSLEVGSVEGNP